MSEKFRLFLALGALGLLSSFSLTGAYIITSTVVDGVPENLNINTAPFVKVGKGYYYIEQNKRASWYDAYLACREMGAELASFESREELDAMDAYIPIKYSLRQYWTSGTDLVEKGKHVWFPNGVPLSEDLWFPGEPNDAGGNERCDLFVYKEWGALA